MRPVLLGDALNQFALELFDDLAALGERRLPGVSQRQALALPVDRRARDQARILEPLEDRH
ncbi:MAG: hypothetical protein ACXU7O_03925, partial [Croceibacterium sp.]